MGRLRVGLGFDVHRLVAGRECILGGVRLPHDTGPLGHSDGDAVLHAIADALLSAAGLDDLGTLYSDEDPRWRGADSAALLADAVARVHARGGARRKTARSACPSRRRRAPCPARVSGSIRAESRG